MESDYRDMLKSIGEYSLAPWESIPDLGLYMDQVITFITRMYEPLYGDNARSYLSAPMINNYVKAKLIPRPTGKKYSREQIALLTIIVALKQVSSMEDIRIMLTLQGDMSIEQLYTLFRERHRTIISSMVEDEINQLCDLPPSINFAIVSSGYRAGCEAILRTQPKESTEKN